ncbi:MAG: hypothetical protein PUI29_05585 [Aeromonadales bacterium]|jgi:hypothetical protein|nr:hypothetical protein [Aeromonadales bacterium]MDY2890464.1 hypothetical protein [Succinivibrio sp.]
MAIELLNPSLGLAGILPSEGSAHLPDAGSFVSKAQGQATLSALFPSDQAKAAIMSALRPRQRRPEQCTPEYLSRNLRRAMQDLKGSGDPDAQALAGGPLSELSDDAELLRACQGMMVGS